MLRSFDFIEYSKENSSIQDKSSFNQELMIAEKQVRNSKGHFASAESKCICGSKMNYFFSKWGITYNRCPSCGSIIADVSKEEISYFKSCKELTDFRASNFYQESACEKRDLSWEELIDWLRFRTYRYLGEKSVSIVDYGNRYYGLIHKLKNSSFCKHYNLKASILNENSVSDSNISQSDIVLYLNILQQSLTPVEDLRNAGICLKPNGLLFFSTRIGTGFDVLTLREHSKIFPFEHVFLPSIQALEIMLQQAGYKVLEVSTPGRLDAIYVKDQMEQICSEEYFIKYLMEYADNDILQEFQRFLQRSNMSSYVQIVAQKMEDTK